MPCLKKKKCLKCLGLQDFANSCIRIWSKSCKLSANIFHSSSEITSVCKESIFVGANTTGLIASGSIVGEVTIKWPPNLAPMTNWKFEELFQNDQCNLSILFFCLIDISHHSNFVPKNLPTKQTIRLTLTSQILIKSCLFHPSIHSQIIHHWHVKS